MGRNNSRRLSGSRDFRQRLVLATLASTPITIKDICAGEEGLRPHEMSLLHLLDKVSDEHVIDVNDTGKGAPACGFFDLGWLVAGHGWVRSWAGTKVGYKPGVVVGWKDLEHDCGVHRGIGYFIEPLLLLGLFARSPLSARLKGITNDTKDPSVDTFGMVMLHMLKHFGVPLDGMELKIESRGAPPHGGGEVLLRVPNINSTLKAVNWVDEGMVQRIRGVAFSTIVSPRIVSRLWRVCSC